MENINVIARIPLFPSTETRIRELKLDFADIPGSSGIYGIHAYPAMMHFRVARWLLEHYSSPSSVVLDPFVGSGVSVIEAGSLGRKGVGFDINPLAILIAKVRATPISEPVLRHELAQIEIRYQRARASRINFPNYAFWFKPDVINGLSRIRKAIDASTLPELKDFFKVSFSETVRKSSNTRFNEFKLFRIADLSRHNPNPIEIFRKFSEKNIQRLTEWHSHLKRYTIPEFLIHDSLEKLPLGEQSVDLILTSPPYGDSRTTVAYGQFSRLPLQWLGIEEQVDSGSLGRSCPRGIIPPEVSGPLFPLFELLYCKKQKRALEVLSFYEDLFVSIMNLAPLVKLGGYSCFLVGNRRVLGYELPTDQIVVGFHQFLGFQHEKTLVRLISNKRMPLENSPTNIPGKKDTTMRYEYIVICKKTKHVVIDNTHAGMLFDAAWEPYLALKGK